jgi:rhodanese-related sulfurtransferase/mannose-6-phosphate isomerase-like protein (cupin superfamily)
MEFAIDKGLESEGGSTSILSGSDFAPDSGPNLGADLKTPEELAKIVTLFASSAGWMDRVRLRSDHRWYERLYQGPSHDIWVISWLPGQSTGFHDHGESAGAFVVATGALEEHRPGELPLAIPPGQLRAFGPDYAHDVRNVSFAPAVSIHAYSPPLKEMNEYKLDGSRLVPRERASDLPERESRVVGDSQAGPVLLGIEQTLLASRARLRRLSPNEAYEAATKTKAILVDIRPEGQRAIEGSIPGAWVVERNVLEWRFDPASSARLPIATDHDLQVIVFCSEGYASSLAATSLQDLGLWRATDIVGGYDAWRAAGLPIVPPLADSVRA